MSKEFKAPREMQAIQQEYTQVCMQAGDLQYKIQAHKKDLEVLNNTLKDLNFEAVASSEAAAKAAEAAKPAPANVTSISEGQSNG